MISLQRRCKKHRQNQVFSIRGAYFWKNKPRSTILRDFGEEFYALGSFTGQQYFALFPDLTPSFCTILELKSYALWKKLSKRLIKNCSISGISLINNVSIEEWTYIFCNSSLMTYEIHGSGASKFISFIMHLTSDNISMSSRSTLYQNRCHILITPLPYMILKWAPWNEKSNESSLSSTIILPFFQTSA